MVTITNSFSMIYESTKLEEKQIILKLTQSCTVPKIKAIF